MKSNHISQKGLVYILFLVLLSISVSGYDFVIDDFNRANSTIVGDSTIGITWEEFEFDTNTANISNNQLVLTKTNDTAFSATACLPLGNLQNLNITFRAESIDASGNGGYAISFNKHNVTCDPSVDTTCTSFSYFQYMNTYNYIRTYADGVLNDTIAIATSFDVPYMYRVRYNDSTISMVRWNHGSAESSGTLIATTNYTSTAGEYFCFSKIGDASHIASAEFQNVTYYNAQLNDTQQTRSINFSFYDETTDTNISANYTGNFDFSVFDQGNPDTYSVTGQNVNYFDVYKGVDFNYTVEEYTILYSAYEYPQRTYYITDALFTDSLQTHNLYLLKDSEGIYGYFNIEDSYGNRLSGVQVKVERFIDSSYKIMQIQDSDDSGLATVFVNPDVTYRFTFTLSGYTTQVLELRVTTSELYNVIMTTTTDTTQGNSTGLDYDWTPNNQQLFNNTYYNFSFNMTSSYWEITACTLQLQNSSAIMGSSTGYTAETCHLGFEVQTGNLSVTSIFLNATYSLNGTVMPTLLKYYTVSDSYTGEFSLKNFLDDISDFSGAGFNNFTRMFIALIAILSIVIMLNKFGVRDTVGIAWAITFLIWFFSYLNWFYVDFPLIPVILGFDLKKYMILMLTMVITAAYTMERLR